MIEILFMTFMCITCEDRLVFDTSEVAVDHMTKNPFHQMVYYDDKSIDTALEKVKLNLEDSI